MKNQVSYMNKNNILSEGKLADMLKVFKFLGKTKKQGLSKSDKKLLKNRSVLRSLAKFHAIMKDASADIQRQADELGIELYQGS